MKKRKNSRNIFILIAAVTILVSACASGDMAADDTVTDGINIGNEDTVIFDDKNDADILDAVTENINAEEEGSGERDSGETENAKFIYKMDEDFIVNYHEVFLENRIFLDLRTTIREPYDVPDCISREEDLIEGFCEGFPEELQRFLIYENDSIDAVSSEERDIRQSYAADCEEVHDYDISDLPLDQLGETTGNYGMDAVDIDADGEDEYIFYRFIEGTAGASYSQIIVMEHDGESGWHVIGYGTAPYKGAAAYVFDYEGTKYIMNVNLLACWNDGYDGAAFDDDEKPWNVMAVNRELTGYTVNEIYSREGDDTDYLAGVDLEDPENNAERDYSMIRSYVATAWDCGDWSMRRVCDWEEEYGGKTYLYVASNFNYMGWPQYDLLLTIFEEGENSMEAVGVYYFAAHYHLTLEREECGVDGAWNIMEGDKDLTGE